MTTRAPGFRRTRHIGGPAVAALVATTLLVGCATAADGPAITAIDEPAAPETTERAITTERTTTTAQPTTTTTEAPTTTAPEEDEVDTAGSSAGDQEVYAVGEWAHTSGFDVTVHQVQDPYVPTNEFETPQPGHRYVAVEVELRNTSDGMQTFSSLLGAEVTDSMNRPWDIGFAGFDLPQIDGDVPPGGARRGWMVFEVAEDSTELILRIKGSLTATGSLFALG